MRQITKLIVTGLVFLSSHAFAQPVAIVCYGQNDEGLSLYLDDQVPGAAFHSKTAGVESSFISSPSAWGKRHSFTTIQNGKFRSQVIGGDPVNPIIVSSVELVMSPEAPGRMKLVSASVYYGSVKYNVRSLSGTSCYVQ